MLAGIFAALVGAGHLAGWFGGYFDRAAAQTLIMATNTAFGIFLAGLALALMKPSPFSTTRQWVVRGRACWCW